MLDRSFAAYFETATKGMNMQTQSATLVIGASSQIAQALIKLLVERGQKVIAVTRSPLEVPELTNQESVIVKTCNYNEVSIPETVVDIFSRYHIRNIYICNGILHCNGVFPEKKVEEVSLDSYLTVLTANTVIPMLWLKYIVPQIEQQTSTLTILSARIGSINDNKLGGWYSYRSSKAALNMAVKTLAIECKRRAKALTFILFHPGTTDTPLSKPFQRNVPKGKLFSCEFVAKRLLALVDGYSADDTDEELNDFVTRLSEQAVQEDTENLKYIDWDGQPISW